MHLILLKGLRARKRSALSVTLRDRMSENRKSKTLYYILRLLDSASLHESQINPSRSCTALSCH